MISPYTQFKKVFIFICFDASLTIIVLLIGISSLFIFDNSQYIIGIIVVAGFLISIIVPFFELLLVLHMRQDLMVYTCTKMNIITDVIAEDNFTQGLVIRQLIEDRKAAEDTGWFILI